MSNVVQHDHLKKNAERGDDSFPLSVIYIEPQRN